MASVSAKSFDAPDERGMHVRHDDGTEVDIAAGDADLIDPGHDAWVTGDEAFVGYEFESATAETFARPS